MGIPGFNVWFSETYDSSYIPLKDVGTIDHIYIDMNSVLHSTLRTGAWGGAGASAGLPGCPPPAAATSLQSPRSFAARQQATQPPLLLHAQRPAWTASS